MHAVILKAGWPGRASKKKIDLEKARPKNRKSKDIEVRHRDIFSDDSLSTACPYAVTSVSGISVSLARDMDRCAEKGSEGTVPPDFSRSTALDLNQSHQFLAALWQKTAEILALTGRLFFVFPYATMFQNSYETVPLKSILKSETNVYRMFTPT